jgi:hypothetical protein
MMNLGGRERLSQVVWILVTRYLTTGPKAGKLPGGCQVVFPGDQVLTNKPWR